MHTDNITLKRDKVNILPSAISNNSINKREIKCEVHDNINKYLKCRRSLILRYCGEVCDTTHEVGESKYYDTLMKDCGFGIVYVYTDQA